MANPALGDYVKENLERGVSQAALRDELDKAGWKKDEIDSALSAKPSKAPARPGSRPRLQERAFEAIKKIPTLYLILLAVLVLAALGTGTYYAYSFILASSQSVATIIVQNDTIIPEGTPKPVSPSLPPESTPANPTVGGPSGTPYVVVTPPPTPVPTAQAAKGAPKISGISNFSITSDSAAISWFTDVASTSRVIYGYASLNQTFDQNDSATGHNVRLAGLLANTTYSYAVASCAGTRCRYAETNSFTTQPFTLVAADVDRIEIFPCNPKIYVNQTQQFGLSVVYKSGARTNLSMSILGWNSSNSSVGWVNSTGAFNPGATGSTRIGGLLRNATVQGADVKNYWNWTEITVEKATPKLTLTVGPASLIEYDTAATASCTASTTQVTPTLTRDGLYLGRASDSFKFDVGSHTYACSTNETANYTAVGTYSSILVKKIPAKPKLLINATEWTADRTVYMSQGFFYATFSYTDATTATTDSECQFNVPCKISTTGAFTFVAYNPGDSNHVTASVTRVLNIMP